MRRYCRSYLRDVDVNVANVFECFGYVRACVRMRFSECRCVRMCKPLYRPMLYRTHTHAHMRTYADRAPRRNAMTPVDDCCCFFFVVVILLLLLLLFSQ